MAASCRACRVVHNAPPSTNHPWSKQQVATWLQPHLQSHLHINQQVITTPVNYTWNKGITIKPVILLLLGTSHQKCFSRLCYKCNYPCTAQLARGPQPQSRPTAIIRNGTAWYCCLISNNNLDNIFHFLHPY